MDFSDFDINHLAHKVKLRLLTTETGSIPIKEFICLLPKCNSVILDNDSHKRNAKGVDRSSYKNVKHSVYNDIHTSIMKEISAN